MTQSFTLSVEIHEPDPQKPHADRTQARQFITTDEGVAQRINELRVGLACKLLAESEAKIAEIACEAGFGNLSNFNRQFLKFKQVSPKAYRRQYLDSARAGATAMAFTVWAQTPTS